MTHPTDSKLLHRGIETLARLARKNGVTLRQSYLRVARRARREAAKLIHSGRPRQAERQVRHLRTWLGRLFRDIGRKIAGSAATKAAFAGPLGLVARLLRQRREDRGRAKLYALHAPEVECIGKGKAQARFEFGVKVSLATTNAVAPGGHFVLGARALPGNPYDGHTLAAQIAQTERITGVEIERAYVDRGYRGHDADRDRVILSGQKRGITPTIRRERRRRNAIEPVIGHMKSRRPPRPQLPARPRGRRRQPRPRRRRPQPPPAPRLAGLALGVPAQPADAISSDRRRLSAAATGRLNGT